MSGNLIARRQLLQAVSLFGLPLAQRFALAQSAGPSWSDAAAKKLKREQEDAYRRLAEQLKLGSDPMAAYRYLNRDLMPLEKISRQRFEETFGPTWGNTAASFDDGYARYLKFRNAGAPTPYEDPNYYSLLLEMTDAIETEIKSKVDNLKSLKAAIPHVVVGSLPTGQVNAVTEPVPGTSEYLVLFHYGVFNFAFEMSKIAGRAFPPLRPGPDGVTFAAEPDPVGFAETHPEILTQFNKVLQAYVVLGDPRRAPKFPMNDSEFPVEGTLLRSMELFLLCHEYAHLLLRHLEKQHDSQDEYDADQLGMVMMTKVMSDASLRYSYWGADYMLSCCDALEQCLSVLRSGSVDQTAVSPSHPPTPSRRERLRAVLRGLSPGNETEAAIRLATQLQGFVDSLCQQSIADWKQMYKENVRPSEAWG
jgi:hypothetical protein